MQQLSVSVARPGFVPAIAALLAAIAAVPAAVAVESLEITGNVTLTNDYVYRGVSQTMGGGALQLGVDVVHESNVFASAWTSNIDYVPDGEADDGAETEIDLALGYSHRLSQRLSADVTWLRYVFPGTRPGYDYDYSEWIGSLTLDENHSISFGHARNVFGSPADALYYAVSSNYELPRALALQLQAGYFDLRKAYGDAYSHAVIVLSKDFDPFTIGLSYQFTSHEARALFPAVNAEPRWVFTIGVVF